jgi:hypothetical protein
MGQEVKALFSVLMSLILSSVSSAIFINIIRLPISKMAHTVLYYELPTFTDNNKWDSSLKNWQVKEPQLDYIKQLTESMEEGLSKIISSYPSVDLTLRLIANGSSHVRYLAIFNGSKATEFESALATFLAAGMDKGFAPFLVDGDKQPLEKILNTYSLTQKSNFPYIGKEIGRTVVKLEKA